MDGVRSYSEVIHANLAQQNMMATLTWLFGAIGLVLGAVGLYGVTTYDVEQRTSEIGVRMALGADRGDVLRMVLGQGLRLAMAGVALGLVATFGITGLIRAQLYGVTPTDPFILSGVVILLIAVALFACWIPARRATRVDPIVALRKE